MSDVSFAFRVLQKIQGRRTLDLYEDRLRTQWLALGELRRRQLVLLRSLVEDAGRRSPYYRRLFSELGVSVASIRTLDDFASSIPTMTKDELRRHLDEVRAENADPRCILHRSGGSTGEPIAFPRDRLSVASYWADVLLTRSWWGVRMGRPEAKIWGHYGMPPNRLAGLVADARELARRAVLGQTLLSAYEMTPRTMARFARAVQRRRPASLYGYVSALTTFARFLDEQGLELDLPASAVIIVTAEPLFEATRRYLRRVFRRPVANEYGCAEAGLIAFDCGAGHLHVLEASNVVEVIDAEGRSISEGVGEVVVTPLYNLSVPVLRYRLGDVGRITSMPCACGRGGRIFEAIEGRRWSLLRTPRGDVVYPGIVDKIIFTVVPEVQRFRAVQDRIDHMTIEVVAKQGLSQERTRRLVEEMERGIDGVHVDVEMVDEIAPEVSGKHIPIKSLLEEDDQRTR